MPRPADDRKRLVGIVLSGAVLAGALQSVLLTYSADGRVNFIDDSLILLGLAVTIPRMLNAPALPAAAVILWITWLTAQLLNSNPAVPMDAVLLTFRQVVMPSVVVLVAMTLTKQEWRRVATCSLVVATVNGLYCYVEKLGNLRLIDPAPLAIQQKVYLTSDGLPGYYVSYFASSEYVRAGGVFLNPPITGIACAVGAVIASTRSGLVAKSTTFMLAGAAVLTFSRAGMLILAFALGYRYLARYLGRLVSFFAMVGATLVGVGMVVTQGSEAHLDGLYQGVRDVLSYPFGRGFGYAGNLLAHAGLGPTESLVAIALTSGGLVIAAIFVAAIVAVGRPRFVRGVDPYRLVALGLLISAAFAETAGAINATVPAWTILGLVLCGWSTADLSRKDAEMKRIEVPA